MNDHVLSLMKLFICFVILFAFHHGKRRKQRNKEAGATSIGCLTNWIVDLEERGNNMIRQEELFWKATIYKVPAHKRDLNPDLFTPKFISFGPFHHDHPELKKMDVHKERAPVRFLGRKNQPCQNIIQEVAKIITELRDAYCCLDDKWKTNDEEFLKMMIVDGCFMLEVLHFNLDLERGYSDMDPLFSKHAFFHKLRHIKRDMLLIENQLPLLLLKALVLFQLLSNRAKQDIDHYVNTLVLYLFGIGDSTCTITTLGLHSLDLYRRSRLKLVSEPLDLYRRFGHKPLYKSSFGLDSPFPIALPYKCTVDLWEAGVSFKPSETERLNDIIFNYESGTLCLPAVWVDGSTESCLLNVIAYEDLHVNMEHVATSYACLMYGLLKSANDVRVLRDNRIIHTHLVSNEEVVGMFDRIAKDTAMDWNSSLVEVRALANKYSQKRRNRWRATLVHDYFTSPWSALSLVGALLAIGLTNVATVYTVLQYYRSS